MTRYMKSGMPDIPGPFVNGGSFKQNREKDIALKRILTYNLSWNSLNSKGEQTWSY